MGDWGNFMGDILPPKRWVGPAPQISKNGKDKIQKEIWIWAQWTVRVEAGILPCLVVSRPFSARKYLLPQKMLLANFECKERQLTVKINAVVTCGDHWETTFQFRVTAWLPASLLIQARQTFMNPEVLTEALGGFGGTWTWLFCFSHCIAAPLGASLPPVLPDVGSFVRQLSRLNS